MASRGGGGKKDGKKEADPEEQMKKKFRAKCLFRALGRLVMANAYWLSEAVDQYEGVEDVKRRVQQAVRAKAKKKQLLTITDKALLNKPADERTEQEKKYIYRIIGGLKCFKRYPNHVKKKLAAVTYYKYYGPGRAIVRQHHEAHALYFIVAGDVIVSQMIFDELLQQYVSIEVGSMHSGDMFGEVSLLHNIPRTATVTTVGHCELLALMKEDFKNILQASVQKQWDEVRRAMMAFTYFDALDEVARREGCIVAKMKSYEPSETLLGDGVGIANFVYFILSGRCQMIETIQVVVKRHLGRSFYSLYDPYVPKEESEQDFDAKYFGAYKKPKESQGSVSEEYSASQTKENLPRDSSKGLGSILKPPSSSKQLRYSGQRESIQIVVGTDESKRVSTSSTASQSAALQSGSSKSQVLLHPSEQTRESVRLSVVPEGIGVDRRPANLQTYFMQVCIFNPGSSFGFGEDMRDRRIVALTPVDCMLLPKIWLLQRNTANIWTRIQHYLEKKSEGSLTNTLWALSQPHLSVVHLAGQRARLWRPKDVRITIPVAQIPPKKQLFKSFVEERRWRDFRDELVDDVVSRSNTVNWTSVHDVPYSIRMNEMLDI